MNIILTFSTGKAVELTSQEMQEMAGYLNLLTSCNRENIDRDRPAPPSWYPWSPEVIYEAGDTVSLNGENVLIKDHLDVDSVELER